MSEKGAQINCGGCQTGNAMLVTRTGRYVSTILFTGAKGSLISIAYSSGMAKPEQQEQAQKGEQQSVSSAGQAAFFGALHSVLWPQARATTSPQGTQERTIIRTANINAVKRRTGSKVAVG
jgi:hypothetical protein